MRTKKTQSIQLLVALLFPVIALVLSIVRPVSAGDSSKSWFTVTVDPVLEKVCVGQKVWLYYTARFDGFGYCREKNCGKDGPTSSTGPGTVISSGQGHVETYDKQLETKDTTTVAFWVLERAIFIPDKAGKVSVNVNSAFFDATATDVWRFNVTEKCEYDVEISANESGFKMPYRPDGE